MVADLIKLADIFHWTRSLFAQPEPLIALIGLLLSLLLLLFGWKRAVRAWSAKANQERAAQLAQLERVVGPLYTFYRESYARFDEWKARHPDREKPRQPFFSTERNESFVGQTLSEFRTHSPRELVQLWSEFSGSDRSTRPQVRSEIVRHIVQRYHELRKSLGLDYDEEELSRGDFIS